MFQHNFAEKMIMKNLVLTIAATVIYNFLFTQKEDSLKQNYFNTAENLLKSKPGLSIGGYGEVHYNQPIESNTHRFGQMDVHRTVLFIGYNYDSRTQFITEIEFEYAKELWLEQMFIQQKLNKHINFRAGLLLIPMGILNEYHEPTTFNGVERPIIDNKISPTTWREIGAGFYGNMVDFNFKYQLYLVNGLLGYDGNKALFSGDKFIREGRQKGSKALFLTPSFTGKIEYYGIKNLNIGISCYSGKSYSTLYSKLNKDSILDIKRADSSSVGINMVGFDLRYNHSGLQSRGQIYYANISNTEKYNLFTSKNGINNDLGSSILGYYIELSYNILKPFKNINHQLHYFIRYENFDTHFKVMNPVKKNDAYNFTYITTGISYFPLKNMCFKSDFQIYKNSTENLFSKAIHLGFGLIF